MLQQFSEQVNTKATDSKSQGSDKIEHIRMKVALIMNMKQLIYILHVALLKICNCTTGNMDKDFRYTVNPNAPNKFKSHENKSMQCAT